MTGADVLDFGEAFDQLEALVVANPELEKPFHEAAVAVSEGDWTPLTRFLAQHYRFGAGVAALMLHAQYQSLWTETWESSLELFRRVTVGEKPAMHELTRTYGQCVQQLQVCHDPKTNMPSDKRQLYESWWKLIARYFGAALAPECERLHLDPAALLITGIDATLENSVRNALVERMELLQRSTIQAGPPKANDDQAQIGTPQTKLPTLKHWAMEAWQARQLNVSVTEIAKRLAEKYRDPKITQPRVSEQIPLAQKHAEMSGLAEVAAKVMPQGGSRAPARTLDPSAADDGQRTDGRAKHLREKAREIAKEE